MNFVSNLIWGQRPDYRSLLDNQRETDCCGLRAWAQKKEVQWYKHVRNLLFITSAVSVALIAFERLFPGSLLIEPKFVLQGFALGVCVITICGGCCLWRNDPMSELRKKRKLLEAEIKKAEQLAKDKLASEQKLTQTLQTHQQQMEKEHEEKTELIEKNTELSQQLLDQEKELKETLDKIEKQREEFIKAVKMWQEKLNAPVLETSDVGLIQQSEDAIKLRETIARLKKEKIFE